MQKNKIFVLLCKEVHNYIVIVQVKKKHVSSAVDLWNVEENFGTVILKNFNLAKKTRLKNILLRILYP
jgi:hypothetical protein